MADHTHLHDEPENKTEGREPRGEERKEDRREGEKERGKETERREIKVPLSSLRTHPSMSYRLLARFHHHTILPEWESSIQHMAIWKHAQQTSGFRKKMRLQFDGP